ncbi:MAG: hypothetical protein WCG83_01870 [Candidatus Peregrinibacteria bacterium]
MLSIKKSTYNLPLTPSSLTIRMLSFFAALIDGIERRWNCVLFVVFLVEETNTYKTHTVPSPFLKTITNQNALNTLRARREKVRMRDAGGEDFLEAFEHYEINS